MGEQLFAITLNATGEVRDADGNLVSSDPITATLTATAEQVAALTQGESP